MMMVIDRLSTQLGVNYIDLYTGSLLFRQNPKNLQSKHVQLREVFTTAERDFLACLALEYLQDRDLTRSECGYSIRKR
jgi:hypothetical protein